MDKNKEIVLLDFWAEWCSPCKRLSLIIDDVVSDFNGMIEMEKINVEDETETVEQFGVQNLPTLILLIDRNEVARRSGAITKESLFKWIESNIQ